uniref:Uncharacterized protein n=1 Tax=Meloidogyne enterolobii TaxID=390850 RepID=A0A6V7WH59_MELEN|nr:unnamed protein product [Meloidogyne enterolobii]
MLKLVFIFWGLQDKTNSKQLCYKAALIYKNTSKHKTSNTRNKSSQKSIKRKSPNQQAINKLQNARN